MDDKDWYYMIDKGVDIVPKNWLVIAIKACQGAEILFTEQHPVLKYVYVRLGDKSTGDEQHYTFANKHCTSTGCTQGDKKTGALLNCNKYIPFWMRWDNKGLFELGLGVNVGGSAAFLKMDYEEEFDLRLVKASMTTTDKGIWLYLIGEY